MTTAGAVAGAFAAPADRLARLRPGLWLLFALGVTAIWLPPRPPMTDLPQHAGQVALLRDLLLGVSPWAREVRVNLFTPYLLGYGLAAALALVMPVVAAIKLMLTAAYAAFGLVGIALRRELGATPRLDAYGFVSFFGAAYMWGLFPFLIAAPLALGFIWLTLRYLRQGSRGLGLAALGPVLLFAHGLACLWALAVAAALILAQPGPWRTRLARAWPLAPAILGCLVFFVGTPRHELATAGRFAADVYFGTLPSRVQSFAGGLGLATPVTVLLSILLAILPWASGLHIDFRRRSAVIIAGAVVAVMALAPEAAWSSNLIPQRFALLLPTAYACLFADAPAARVFGPWLGLMALAVGYIALARDAFDAVHFAAESRDFEAVLSRAAPGARALSVVLERRSAVVSSPAPYAHFPLWYQAEKHGFVDFNYAYYSQQVVRFAGAPPPFYRQLQRPVGRLDWRGEGPGRYRYVFVRGAPPASLFAGAERPPVVAAVSGAWTLFEFRAPAGR